MLKVAIYADGACAGNPGPGGFGAIIVCNGTEKVLSGGEFKTTNNRQELTGVLEAIKVLKQPCEIDLYSDSQYVCNAFAKGWLQSWRKNGWTKADKKPVQNPDLWKELLAVIERQGHKITTHWIEGHTGHPYNERCDALAVEARIKAAETPPPEKESKVEQEAPAKQETQADDDGAQKTITVYFYVGKEEEYNQRRYYPEGTPDSKIQQDFDEYVKTICDASGWYPVLD